MCGLSHCVTEKKEKGEDRKPLQSLSIKEASPQQTGRINTSPAVNSTPTHGRECLSSKIKYHINWPRVALFVGLVVMDSCSLSLKEVL